jgi:hypothetical protein
MSIGAQHVGRAVLVGVVALVLLGGAGCGGAVRTGAAVLEGPLEVQLSQLYITVANKSSSALTDVRVTIVPSGRMVEFMATYNRLEPGQRRNFSYNDLKSKDGTQFNMRLYRPRAVRVTAMDNQKTPYEIVLPWG